MTDTAEYVLVLAIAVALTFAVGRLLLVAGDPFLQEVFRDQKVTRSVNRLLNVLFHLVTLGVVAIISGIDFDLGLGVQTIVVKIGVVLLVLGIAYGISMLVLIRIRERRRAAQIAEAVDERLAARGAPTRPAPQQMPPPDQPGAEPPRPPASRRRPSADAGRSFPRLGSHRGPRRAPDPGRSRRDWGPWTSCACRRRAWSSSRGRPAPASRPGPPRTSPPTRSCPATACARSSAAARTTSRPAPTRSTSWSRSSPSARPAG